MSVRRCYFGNALQHIGALLSAYIRTPAAKLGYIGNQWCTGYSPQLCAVRLAAMSDKKVPALEVQPDKELFFKGPFTEIVVAQVTITNKQDFNISFKISSTRPERYFLTCQGAVLEPDYYLKANVTLLPFDYQQSEESDDEIIIRCIVQPEDQEADLAWNDADPDDIVVYKLKCIPWIPDELLIHPRGELLFEGPFDKVVASTIRLTNPSNNRMYFHVQAPSRDIWVLPDSGILDQKETKVIRVHCKPLDLSTTDLSRDRIIIKSTVLTEKQTEPDENVLCSVKRLDCMLKCVFKSPGMLTSAQSDSGSHCKDASLEMILAELLRLREEVKLLKAQVHNRSPTQPFL